MIGYNKPLYILPFDHRESFVKGLLGDKDKLSDSDIEYIKEQKRIIYEGFKKAIDLGLPKEYSAILVDEIYGKDILVDAKYEGYTTLLAIEKSGESEFTFEYPDFESHLLSLKPTFAKALIRYNDIEGEDLKVRRLEKLKRVNDFCHSNGFKFLVEPIIDANYASHSKLTLTLIEDLQNAGIEPDVWKLEGFEKKEEYENIVSMIRRDERREVGIVILGGGEDKDTVERFIRVGATVSGVIGFAIGRTIFWPAILKLKENQLNREDAVNEIAKNYLHFYSLFENK
ncbi:MAG: hypothetical protein A2W22_05790 [Candidatus Levybacteria bacterium RBG_16_35_11]|nr:MAG: hypothetical protein A2W22_05790 [Candidatus Levybacteria bacterium RBG_16_35_11]